MNYGYQGSLEPIVDAEGRLLDPVKIWESKQINIPGDPDDFIADWVEQRKISVTSPIARALIGKKKGDYIEVTTPKGVTSYEVKSVRFK